MKQGQNNYAFIDGQNLYLAISSLGWKLDYKRFRRYLDEKYGVKKAYMFMGYIQANSELYNFLQSVGFVLTFKPILDGPNGKVKGNCDAELVLQAMIDYADYNKAVIVTGDGDFYCLVNHFIAKNKLEKLLVPNQHSYSQLLRRFPSQHLAFVSDLEVKLSYKRKEPRAD